MGQTTFSGPLKSDGGFIENSFTTAERDAIVDPIVGLLIYNTTDNTYEVYNGEDFQPAFGPPVPPVPSTTVTFKYYMSGEAADFTYWLVGLYGEAGPSMSAIQFDAQTVTTYPATAAVLQTLPIGTVITITQGSGLSLPLTFTLNSQFADNYGNLIATTTTPGPFDGSPSFVSNLTATY